MDEVQFARCLALPFGAAGASSQGAPSAPQIPRWSCGRATDNHRRVGVQCSPVRIQLPLRCGRRSPSACGRRWARMQSCNRWRLSPKLPFNKHYKRFMHAQSQDKCCRHRLTSPIDTRNGLQWTPFRSGRPAGAGAGCHRSVCTHHGAAAYSARRCQYRDAGPGRGSMVPAERARVFDRFQRLSPARETSSADLGLRLVRTIALRHRGSVPLADCGPVPQSTTLALAPGRM